MFIRLAVGKIAYFMFPMLSFFLVNVTMHRDSTNLLIRKMLEDSDDAYTISDRQSV